MDHWKKAKRAMRYLQRTKDYMLTYRRSSHLEIVGYLDSISGCLDSRRSTSATSSCYGGGAISWKSNAKSIVKRLCDTVSELASSILLENGWPDLLLFMFQCVTFDLTKLQEAVFLIFTQLALYIGKPYLTSSLSSDVKIAALSDAINFIQCLSSSTDRNRFQDLLPAMMRTITEALNCGQEAKTQEALELLIELVRTEPRFLRLQLVDVVGSMLQIAEAETLEEGTRHLAVKFVIALAETRERAPGMMRKLS
ncbi:hypothetical protein AAG906_018005 [Vitis piasezkii]